MAGDITYLGERKSDFFQKFTKNLLKLWQEELAINWNCNIQIQQK